MVATKARSGDTTTRRSADGADTTRNGITFILDSIPVTAQIALRSDARLFKLFNLGDYEEKFLRSYPRTPDNGLFVARANLQGLGLTDYVLTGRDRGMRSVVAVLRRPDGSGWMVTSVSASEIGSRAPPDKASLWIARGEKRHPNGKWDAVVVKRLYADGPAEIYYWDADRKEFFAR